MKNTKNFKLISKDRDRNLIFIESNPTDVPLDLASAFRQIESIYYNKLNYRKPWRVVYKDALAQEWEVGLDHTRWPRSYANWDRRYNPDVKKERWHGLMWDTLKNSETL